MFIVVAIAMLIVYALLVLYVGRSSWRWMKPKHNRWFKWVYIVLLSVLSLSFVLGRFGEGSLLLQGIGSYWLAVFCLLLLILPCVHLGMWLLRITSLSKQRIHQTAGVIVLVSFVFLLVYGTFNAYNPIVRAYTIDIDKPNASEQTLKIVMAADMHFGVLSGEKHARRLVEEINALNPDLVLFPGDIIDDDLRPFLDRNMGEILSGIQSKYGVYASLGNHDKTPGGMDKLIETLEQANMSVLYDEAVTIADSFILIGRKDKIDHYRAPLAELVAELDQAKPLILLDHQPYELGIAAEQGIDLIVSGHTHRGQVAPANLITNWLYENDWGYLLKDGMHSIVTSGYGFWGPPIRLGSRSEIVQIEVRFAE